MINIFDTLVSLVSGIGTAKDKMTSLTHVYTPLSRGDIEAAYRSDWVTRKAVDIPPYDEIKNGRDWQATQDQINKIEEEEKRLQFRRKVLRARILARLHGGSAIYLGTGDPNLALPLNVDRIGQGGLMYLHVLSRYELSAAETDRDVTSAWYGEPEMWQMQSGALAQIDIHPSRIIKFIGSALPDPMLAAEAWWGDSVLDAIDQSIKQMGLTYHGVATMINEAKLDVISIPGLMNNMSDNNYTAKLTKRFTLANQMKSLVNALVIDSNEQFNTKQLNFGTLPEVMDRFVQAVSGAADIPATRFMSQAPQGMNATGDGDYRNYLDRIKSGQELDLQPTISPIDECLIRSALGTRDQSIFYNWSPLWHMTEKETADLEDKRADTAKKYYDMGVIPGDAFAKVVVNRLIEDGTFPGLEKAIKESPLKVGEDQIGNDDEVGAAGRAAGEKPGEGVSGPGANDNRRALRRLPPANRPAASRRLAIRDARPMTLYIQRKVVNADEIVAWAKSQGIRDIEDDLHVTITYSKQPIDWMAVPGMWADRDIEIVGGPRIIEKFGENSTVLLFASRELGYRHSEVNEATGATWDYPEYQPHITLSYTEDRPREDFEPYQGKIILGPEVWSEIKVKVPEDA